MRVKLALVGLLAGVAILLAGCSGLTQTDVSAVESIAVPQASAVPGTTEVTATSVVTDEVSSETPSTTTTVPQFVDLPEPVRMFSDDLEVKDVPVGTDEICQDGICSPPAGSVVFKPIDLNGATPGEVGIAYVIGHVNRGEPFFNLIDDAPSDYQDDHGLEVGDTVSFELADGQICSYGVIPPLLDESTEHVFSVPGQPAVYWDKDPNIKLVPLNELLNRYGSSGRSLLLMAVSYGGPGGDQKAAGHRLNNGIVMAELIGCDSP